MKVVNKAFDQDCIVIGGGVIGLLTALELANAGIKVLIVERQQVGKESSWAGGGILGALQPWKYPDAIHVLARWSQQYYPKLITDLQNVTDIDSEFIQSGMLYLDESLHELVAWAKHHQKSYEIIDEDNLKKILPIVSNKCNQAILFPEISQLRNPFFLKALINALLQNKRVSILENTACESILIDKGRVSGVKINQAEIKADSVIACAGAWTGQLLAKFGLERLIQPIKGEMVLLKAEPGFIQHIVNYQGFYLIPRRDGHLLAGSTVESVGLSKTITKQAEDRILGSLYQAIPGLSAFKPIRQWSGLRPGSPSGVPIISQIPEIEGLYVNAGHYRNGLLLAPGSARLMADILLNRTPIINSGPYSFDAFVS